MDDTRLHPDVYHRNNWAVKIAIDALERLEGDGGKGADKDSFGIKCLRDVIANSGNEVERLFNATKSEWETHYGPTFNIAAWDPIVNVPAGHWRDKVEELDLEAFANIYAAGFEAIAAKVDNEACTAYMGKGSAGNYVKMVHNGIEYAIMQLISEAYDLLKRGAGLNNEQLYEVFRDWNNGEMNSFLIEITRDIFTQKDSFTENYLVDQILDKAGAKGTGKWTSEQAMEIGVSIPTIDIAVTSRILSAYKEERVQASKIYAEKEITKPEDIELFIKEVGDALFLSTLISYAQGLSLLVKASGEYGFEIPLKDVVKIWRHRYGR